MCLKNDLSYYVTLFFLVLLMLVSGGMGIYLSAHPQETVMERSREG